MKSGHERPVLLLIHESSEVEERNSWRAAIRCSTLNPAETHTVERPPPAVKILSRSATVTESQTCCACAGRPVKCTWICAAPPTPFLSPELESPRIIFFDPHLGREKEELGRSIPLARCRKGRGCVAPSIYSAPSPRRYTRRPPGKATRPGGECASSSR